MPEASYHHSSDPCLYSHLLLPIINSLAELTYYSTTMLAILPLATALLWLGIARATPTNITVLDQSPMITYYPSRSGIDTQTWNVTYDESPWSEFFRGSIPNGTSIHKTYFIGATASFGFRGTAVYLQGSGTDFSVTINGETIPSGGGSGIMAMKSGMENKWWDVVVEVTGSTGVAIESVIFTVEIGNQGSVKIVNLLHRRPCSWLI
jgi:hypothetical protein